jgi:hypothetical protein
LKNKDFLINNGLDAGQGPSNPNARSIAVPNECIHMVLGKGGDTLKEIQYTSGAERVELSTVVTPGTNSRNVYVDGSYEAYTKVKALLEQIIDAHMKMKLNVIGNQRLNDLNIMANMQIPAKYLSKIVGKNGGILK